MSKKAEKLALAALARAMSAGGGKITVDSELSTESENPVQNKVITAALGGIVSPTIGYGMIALAPPVVTGGVNSIAWEDNPLNAGKSATVTADVDGVPVTSPLTITQAMDGSTLTITASADGYADGVTTIQLAYYDVTTKSLFAIPNPSNPDKLKDILYLGIYISAGPSNVKGRVNGEDITFTSSNQAMAIPVIPNSTATYDFSFELLSAPIYNKAIILGIWTTNTELTNPVATTAVITNGISGSATLLRNGEIYNTVTWNNTNQPICGIPYSASMAVGDKYTLIFNITSYTLNYS